MATKLDKETIARVTLDLADECGIDNVSMRQIAAELGVTPMALYTYFPSREAIAAAAVAYAYREVDTSRIPGERWDDTMRRTMHSIRALYLRHSNANLTKVEGLGYADGMIEHTEAVYALHGEQGIPEDVLRKAWCIVDAFLGGFIAAELEEMHATADMPDPEGRQWLETAENAYTDQSFDDGIEIIIAGLRGICAPDPCDWRTPER